MIKLRKSVCVLGGVGMVGRAVIPALAREGYQVSVAVNHPERYRELSLVPGVKLLELQGLDFPSLASLFKSHDIVINLFADQTHSSEILEDQAFVSTIQNIKKAAESCHIKRLIQLSHLGANASQAKHDWLRVLGESDAIIHSMASTYTTVLRPGLLIGEGDYTTSLYKAQLAKAKFMMVANADVQIQPLWVKDFANALVGCINNPACFNTKLEMVGEEVMTIKDLAEWVKDFMELNQAVIVPMCQMNAKFMLMLGGLAPFKTVNRFQQKQLSVDLVSQQDFTTRFGFVPASIEVILSSYILPHQVRQRYAFFRTHAGRIQQEFD